MNILKEVTEYRKEAGINTTAWAASLGIAVETWSRIEHGKQDMGWEIKRRIAKTYPALVGKIIAEFLS